jgi:hypothetical protein
MIRLNFLSYSIDIDCPSGNTILTFRLEAFFVLKKNIYSEDTTMPLKGEINACAEESHRPFSFIEIVQI